MSNTYVVTGANRGIGLELTRQLLKLGHSVITLCRNSGQSQELLSFKEEYPNRLHLFSGDVSSDKDIQRWTSQLGGFPSIDVLINNAGVYGSASSFEKVPLEDVAHTLATNSIAPMRVTQALLPWLKKSKNPKVIYISSVMGSIAQTESPAVYGYRMSKAALNMFHRVFAIEFPQIISLALHPGWVKTDMGGAGAQIEAAHSVQGILQQIENAEKRDSGKFLDYLGKELPW